VRRNKIGRSVDYQKIPTGGGGYLLMDLHNLHKFLRSPEHGRVHEAEHIG